MTFLPDVNVWIALVVKQHIGHTAVRRWIEEAQGDSLAFCRVTQMGFMRLLTSPRVMAEDAFTPSHAWHLLDMFYEDSRILFAAEPPGLEASWRALTKSRAPGANFWTDAYLAAFASAAGHTVVTFDRGFHRFDKLKLRWLAADA